MYMPGDFFVCKFSKEIHAFFNKKRFFFFSTQPQCCLTSSWIELQMLLRCCLIHITIIILRHILYLACFCSYLCLHLFIYVVSFCSWCDLLFIFIFINHKTLLKRRTCFFVHILLYLNDNLDEKSEKFSNSWKSASECCLAFAYFFVNFSLALLIKVLLIKKKRV